MRVSVQGLGGLLTVVVLTQDEEDLLPGLIAHVPSDVAVVVVDSGSSDGTVAVASEAGCLVREERWRGFAHQRNVALQDESLNTPWVLFIDADERMLPQFWLWAASTLDTATDVDVFEVPSVLVYRSRRLRHAPGYPIVHPRLVRPSVRFVPNHEGHGEMVEHGRRASSAPVGYEHFFFHRGLSEWLDKHRLHAEMAVAAERADARPATARARLSTKVKSGVVRPFLRFGYHYVVRRGFLDGRAGLEFSLLYTWFELTKALYKRAGDAGSENVDTPLLAET